MAGDPLNLMAHPFHYERFYDATRRMARELVPQHHVRLAINEWGLGLPEQRQHSIEAAIYAARLMNVFERNSDLIALSAVSDLVNGWPGGIIQASRHGLFVTPTYLVNQLYRANQGAERLAASVQSPTFDTSREGKNVPYLDVVATRDTNRTHIFIKAVNAHLTRALDVDIEIDGLAFGSDAEMFLISADSAATPNSFRNPNAVVIRKSHIRVEPRFQITLPRQGIAVIRFNVRGGG